jgi:hypothetical protein
MDAETCPSSWLVLLAQLPSKPSSARVALWRRMRTAGATAVVNGAWMLPRTTAHEDFFEQSREGVIRRGGTGFVLRVSGSSRNRMNRSCGFSSPTGPVNMTSSRSDAPPFSMKLTNADVPCEASRRRFTKSRGCRSPPRDGIIPIPWRPSQKSVDLVSTVTTLPAPLATQTTTVKRSA